MRWQERVFLIADGAVTILGLVLTVALVIFFSVTAWMVVVTAGPMVGLITMVPVALLIAACGIALREWWDHL